jgi:hypothetical protein
MYLEFQNSSERNFLLHLYKQINVKLPLAYHERMEGSGGIAPLTLKP